ncbi:hypothetical protein EJ06DRAFT_460280, partial [Trichodelitschia bisporula]
FSSGLHGVDQESNFLYTHVLIISFCGLIFFTLLLRWTSMIIAQMRHISAVPNPERQFFWAHNRTTWWPWLKKHFMYAPIWSIRHNNEIRLSKAITIGTLPGRGHTFILVAYTACNIAYCVALPYHQDKMVVLASLRGRTGMLAALNLVPTVLFALRNNPLIRILKTPYDTFNLFHRWTARVFIAESLVHSAAWVASTVAAGHWAAVWSGLTQGKHAASYGPGMIATVLLLIMGLAAWSPLRHAFYEAFLVGHRVLAIATIVLIYIHLDVDHLPQVSWVQAVIVLYALEIAARIARTAYFNYSRRSGPTRVTIEALPSDACRVTFALPRAFPNTPGTHVFAYIPALSWFTSHPFSVAWAPADGEKPRATSVVTLKDPTVLLDRATAKPAASTVSLIVRARTGLTGRMHALASAAPGGVLHTYGAVEGPYGGLDKFGSYGTVVLFAGGVGITHQVSIVRQLVSGFGAGTVATRKVLLVWSVPNTEALEWVRPWMDAILRLPGRRQVLRIELYVTKPRSRAEVHSETGSVHMVPGRCNPHKIIDQQVLEREGAMAVSVCGPGAFADAVRQAARRRVDVGVVDFVEEAFSY